MLEKLIGESKALERAIAGEELNMQDGLELMKYDNIYTIGAVADAIRKKFVIFVLIFAMLKFPPQLQVS